MRFADYLSIAFKNVIRQPLRSFLTIIALTISTCVLVLMIAVSIGGQEVIASQFGTNDSFSLITVTPSQGTASLSPFGEVQQAGVTHVKLDDNSVAELATLPHVKLASPRAHIWEFNTFTMPGTSKAYVAQAEGIPSDAYLPLRAGARFDSNDQQNVVILGYGYAKSLGVDPGKLVGTTLTITTQKGYRGAGAVIPNQYATQQQVEGFNVMPTTVTAKIVAVTQPGPNQNFLYVPLGWAHQVRTARYNENGTIKGVDQLTTDGYTSIQVKADSIEAVASVASKIKDLNYGQTSLLETARQLNQLTATVGYILGAVAVIAMLAATLGVVNTMIMAVSEQRYEIGIWRACGARRRVIVRLFLVEAAVLGLIGGSVGVIASIPLAQFITTYGSSLLQAQGLEPVALVNISPWLGAGAIGITILFSVLAGAYPAYRAARLDPSKILSSN